MEENIGRQISLEEAAAQSYVSAGYFSVLFKDRTGETFSDYVIRMRVEAAKELLREGRYTIAKVAQRVGYADSRRKRAPEDHLTQQILRTQAEIAALQSQINAHFLYNTLETIRGKALLHDDEELAEMIEVLARLFRYNISRHEECAALSEELENVRDCVKIYNYRFDGRFQLIEQYEDMGEEMEQYLLPVLTLQPFVGNAIRHGLEPKMGIGTLLLRVFKTQSNLVIQIQDDGIGMDENALKELRSRLKEPDAPHRRGGTAQSSGIALVNVHQRIQLMFGAIYGVDVVSSPDWGTRVELALPASPPETVGIAK